MADFRLLVCGGRRFNDADLLYSTLDAIHAEHPSIRLCHGGAPGADALAHRWGLDRLGAPKVTLIRAEWDRLGSRAGMVRNERMLREFWPDLVVAFKGKRGTRHMAQIAEDAQVEVRRVQW